MVLERINVLLSLYCYEKSVTTLAIGHLHLPYITNGEILNLSLRRYLEMGYIHLFK